MVNDKRQTLFREQPQSGREGGGSFQVLLSYPVDLGCGIVMARDEMEILQGINDSSATSVSRCFASKPISLSCSSRTSNFELS